MNKKLQKFKNWYLTHERHIGTGALVFGFIVDNFTLQRIDLLFENIVIITYLLLISFGLLLINLSRGGRFSERVQRKLQVLLPPLIQFGFGGIFSAFFVFYTRSATLASSWPFMLFLVGLLVGNEFFRERYTRIRFQVSIYFVALFSFLVFFVPIILKQIGAWVFVLSGILALLGIGAFVYTLFRFIPDVMREHRRALTWSIGAIYVFINILYFTNSIPPIPLSLKDIEIAHAISRSGGTYTLAVEDAPWWRGWILREEYHRAPGESVSVFSSVFAPTDLTTTIRHCWEYFDPHTDAWEESGCVTFPIYGGRDGGYRGYSTKTNVHEGLWRVNVETRRGQLIGRTVFRVYDGTGVGALKIEKR